MDAQNLHLHLFKTVFLMFTYISQNDAYLGRSEPFARIPVFARET